MSEPDAYVEQWSAICPSDLGLKAGYWSGREGDEVAFRPIVGWITWTGRDLRETRPKNGFAAVVVSDVGLPTLATGLPNYLGIFRNELTAAEALRKSEEWRNGPEKQQIAVNVRGVGKA